MTVVVLDSGGLTALAGQRARLAELLRRGAAPPHVPAVVLAEALTGDHRRDASVNRLLAVCQVSTVDEALARDAGRLRTATGRAGSVSGVDAVVAAYARTLPDAAVVTSDPDDLRALTADATPAIRVVAA